MSSKLLNDSGIEDEKDKSLESHEEDDLLDDENDREILDPIARNVIYKAVDVPCTPSSVIRNFQIFDNTIGVNTLLATAIAIIKDLSGNHHRARLLIDPGSELTFVTEDLVNELNLARQQSTLSILGIGGGKVSQTRGQVSICLKSMQSDTTVNVHAHILSQVASNLPSFEDEHHHWNHLRYLKLADAEFWKPRPIDIVIGADFYGQIIKPKIIKGLPSTPIAQHSIFGWLILGPTDFRQPITRLAGVAQCSIEENSLERILTKFWVQEELPLEKESTLSPEEKECEDHFRATHSRDENGKYIVRIPLKQSRTVLGSSYNTAHQCLLRMQKRLARDPIYAQLYREFLAEYEALGHMSKVQSNDTNQSTSYYLPHHGVLRPESETTKLRVVFNGSSSTSSGLSVNDIMHTGPNLLLNIVDILTWIRFHRHIFATDVTKMFRQIKVHQDDWDLQRILWFDEDGNEAAYQLTTVTYGTKAAPYLASRALKQLIEDEGHRFPLAMPSLTSGKYVDDIFGGADNVAQLIEIAKQLVEMCTAGGFPLAKWHSSDPELLEAILASKSTSTTSSSSLSLDDCESKILGLRWIPKEDKFIFSTKFAAIKAKSTKRVILSEVAQIFDPLGFVSPVVIRAKMLLQELWLCKVGWDDPLPSDISGKWLSIRGDLENLAKLSISRWFGTWSNSSVQIHGFSDASKLALSAVIYFVVKSSSSSSAVFVCSKTKVAPLKPLTVNRLELSAALMLAQLTAYVQGTVRINIEGTYLWTDSKCTLTWIRAHPSRWKEYVQNRVSKIQDLTPGCQWGHVPGTSNPADCASRGVTADQLQNHSLWWSGPSWMTKSKESWPVSSSDPEPDSALECRPGLAFHLAVQPQYHWDLIKNCGTFHKLMRLTAICYRIIWKPRGLIDGGPVLSVPAADYQRSRIFWIKATQSLFFPSELKKIHNREQLPSNHQFSRLTAFIDELGVIRVGGRLQHSDLPEEAKHQAILPRHSRLTELIIRQAHHLTLHGGTQVTLAHIRRSYWIIGGRASVKSYILKCVKCARQRGIRAHQLMGQLPLCRATLSRPFTHTGVDYAGPINLKTWKGRGAKTQKGWICVFVCFSTSAVHLETVSDCSSEGFIAAYRRFASRRGLASVIYSDCGTNFVGADKELRKLFRQGSQGNQEIASLLSKDQTDWRFNPPAAPHMGGKWESVVKSIKYHLRRTVGETLLTFEELTTLLAQIEAILNSRPLEPLTDDPEDIFALTPGHFLIGSDLTTVPEPSLMDLSISRLSRWQFIQQRIQQFWKQWSAHYLQRLQAISKWHHPNNNIKVGHLVLLTDERLPPCKWPMARVTELLPGKDGLTRVVKLKTASTILTRPITKLALLPVPTQSDQED